MRYVLWESSTTSLSADRATLSTVSKLLQKAKVITSMNLHYSPELIGNRLGNFDATCIFNSWLIWQILLKLQNGKKLEWIDWVTYNQKIQIFLVRIYSTHKALCNAWWCSFWVNGKFIWRHISELITMQEQILDSLSPGSSACICIYLAVKLHCMIIATDLRQGGGP